MSRCILFIPYSLTFLLALPSVRPTMPNFIGQAAVLEGGSEKALIEDVTTRHRKVCCGDTEG
jgi:hypothetical protein